VVPAASLRRPEPVARLELELPVHRTAPFAAPPGATAGRTTGVLRLERVLAGPAVRHDPRRLGADLGRLTVLVTDSLTWGERVSDLARRHRGVLVAALACGVLAYALLGARPRVRGRPAVAPSPAAADTSAAPSRGNTIVVEGVVRSVDVGAGVARLSWKGHDVAVVLDPAASASMQPGQRVRVEGEVLGRSRFGPLYLRAIRRD
jgi:hypothetical protein